MRFRTFVIGLVVVGTSVLFTSRVLSEDKAPSADLPDLGEMMEKWMATRQPSEHHQRLKHFVGTWNLTLKSYWGGPGSPAAVSKGTSQVKHVLGGRFLLEETCAEMMMPDATGQMKPVPLEGIGLTGYDNFRNMYVATWADNMNTALVSMRGAVDPSGRVFTFYGEMDEPLLKVHGRMVKFVTRIINNDKHIFEVYDLHVSDDYKVMEMLYERK